MSDETKEQVFLALLAEWRSAESAIIGEGLSSQEYTEEDADREAEAWQKRYREATA